MLTLKRKGPLYYGKLFMYEKGSSSSSTVDAQLYLKGKKIVRNLEIRNLVP